LDPLIKRHPVRLDISSKFFPILLYGFAGVAAVIAYVGILLLLQVVVVLAVGIETKQVPLEALASEPAERSTMSPAVVTEARTS